MRNSVAEENIRPHDLVQVDKFTLEAGVVVRKEVPILTHWKEYKGEKPDVIYRTRFVERLNVCMGIPS